MPHCPVVKMLKRCQVIKKMSSCQKDVQCQKVKCVDCGGGSQKKINWHNEVDTYWHQFSCHIWWWPKNLKMCIESVFEYFWWPSYLTSICLNLIMPIYFFLSTSSIVQMFWHLTSFWQLDIFWHLTGPAHPPKEKYFFRTITPSQREIFSQITKKGTSPLTRVDTPQAKVSTLSWGRYPQ